jgi:hypothetical protein
MTTFLIPRDHDFSFPDYESIFARLGTAIDSVLAVWIDRLRAAFENVLLGNQCFNFDVIMGYLEQRIRETRIATVRERSTAVRLARLHHNYRPVEGAAAIGTATLRIAEAVAGNVTFPVGTPVFTGGSNRISGQVTEQKIITAGNTEVDAPWEHSETVTGSFTATGLPRQRFPFDQAPYVWGSAAFADISDDWTEIEHFADYGPTDKVFRVVMDANGYAEAEFGNGTYGAVPSGLINYSYKSGGGVDGNVAAGALTRVTGSFTDHLGNPVTVSATNAAATSGGDGPESVALIRLKAPAAGKAQERSVATGDMESNAARVTSIARVLVLTVNERAGIAENTGHVYAVGYGTTTTSGMYRPIAATASEKTAIETILNTTYPVPSTFDVVTQITVFNEVTFEMTIGITTGFVFADVAQAVYDALDDFFAVADSDADGKGPNLLMDFGTDLTGGKLQWHVLFNEVIDVEGIADIDEDTFVPTGDVTLQAYEWPKLGTVKITDSSTGAVLEF